MSVCSDELESFSEAVASSLKRLNSAEKTVLELRCGFVGKGPMTLKATGDKIGLTRERIRQIENKAVRKLRAYWNNSDYSELLFTGAFCYPVDPQDVASRVNYLAAKNKPGKWLRSKIVKEAKRRKKQEQERSAEGWRRFIRGQHRTKTCMVHAGAIAHIKKRLELLGYKSCGKSMSNGRIVLSAFQSEQFPDRIKLLSEFLI